ncbi:hypothetical protein DIURU_002067 [Diutina rugosa]|uniref:Serine hydrolase domain-containing protein n=1 Tax=Diutina rugosa TaxID=5481 RepID=A0A642URI2_DIURU|nr:uncharacterized protein DIURU_002067 [Diutina rugosa]KAA8904115.1 hypothetical protein DIURU_002067 [Diutina rugosa]
MKVLYLGGFLQNAERLRKRSQPLEAAMARLGYELDYVSPPLTIASKEGVFTSLGRTDKEKEAKWQSITARGLNRCWWYYVPGAKTQGAGLEESMAYIVDYIKKNGPYVGIMGFSQGSSVAAMLTCYLPRALPDFTPFRFAVCISGFKLGPEFAHYFEGSQTVPTKVVVVYGTMDFVVPAAGTQGLCKLFPGATEVSWRGGHDVPQATDIIDQVVSRVGSADTKL